MPNLQVSDERRYRLELVAEHVALMAPEVAEGWRRRGHYRGGSPRKGPGRPILLSERDAMRLAVMAKLVGLGLPVAKAGQCAARFCDGTTGEPAPRDFPGALYPRGQTYLALGRRPSSYVVVNDKPGSNMANLCAQLGGTGFRILNLNEVVTETRTRLARAPLRIARLRPRTSYASTI